MAKQNLLVVDADPRSLRVLEVSLRNAGFNVAGCSSVGKAFEILHTNKPDLILSETGFTDMNGFEFVEQLRQNPEWADIPFMFLSNDESIESKIRGLELGVEDYLTKPIYIREVVARVTIELARQTRDDLAEKTSGAKTRFSGALSEMSVVDLLQTIDVSRKSGVLALRAEEGDQGMVSFDSGAIIRASVDMLEGEEAVYRLLLWRDGSFDLEFREVSLGERTVHRTTQAMLMEGMRRLDEWSRLSELLPSFDVVLEVDGEVLGERLHETPDEHNVIVRLVDGQRSIDAIIRSHGGDHVDALRKLVDLYFEGILREVGEVKNSIPVLSKVQPSASTVPPRAAVDTIPGPGLKSPPGSESPSALESLAITRVAPTSEPASRPVAVPKAPALPRTYLPIGPDDGSDPDGAPAPERRASMPTPVSQPAVSVSEGVPVAPGEPAPDDQADSADAESFVPAADPPLPARDVSFGGWAPAPPPSEDLRPKTPTGFQAVGAGGTLLNWAGRVPRSDPAPPSEATHGGDWDRTLETLREDPDVDEAIAIIDSEPPPGPFLRSEPPGAPSQQPQTFARVPESKPAAPKLGSPAARPFESAAPRPASRPPENARRSEAPAQSVAAAAPRRSPPSRVDGAGNWPWIVTAATLMAIALFIARGEESDPVTTVETEIGRAAQAESTTLSESKPKLEIERAPSGEPEAVAPPPAAVPEVPEVPEPASPETDAAAYATELARARRLKRGLPAVEAYSRAVELNPKGSEALAEWARLELARQNPRKAAELAERATAVDPTSSLGWVTLGAARQELGDRQGARQAYQSCAKLGRGRYVSDCRSMLR